MGGPIRCGLLGIGHAHGLGKLQVLQQSPDYELVGVCEPDDAIRSQWQTDERLDGLRWLTQDELVVEVTREAAKLHVRLQPYVYSAAVDASRTGFPYPMTPLPLAYPDDPAVYELANRDRRSYQWLIGESLLATPLSCIVNAVTTAPKSNSTGPACVTAATPWL